MYEISQKMKERLDNDFTYHPPKEGQAIRYTAIRDKAKELAVLIVQSTPISREQSVSLTELDHVVMMANAAIARNE
jgi:alkyl hydroperoxide reductase subunit AhpC